MVVSKFRANIRVKKKIKKLFTIVMILSPSLNNAARFSIRTRIVRTRTKNAAKKIKRNNRFLKPCPAGAERKKKAPPERGVLIVIVNLLRWPFGLEPS